MRALFATLVLLVVVAPTLAGCLDGGDTPPTGPSPSPGTSTTEPPKPTVNFEAAPWWVAGEFWNVQFTFADGTKRDVKLVHYLNDSTTEHFWLGVSDRRVAFEHALFDTLPLLGRIHWHHLAPHEKGAHAVMYDFPITAGKAWQTPLFGSAWNMRVSETSGGGWHVTGTSSDGAGKTIAYDYDPSFRWFSNVEIRSGGKLELSATITNHGYGDKGSFFFLRGRDYYRGPEAANGGHDETFEVPSTETMTSLAFYVNVKATGPFAVQLLDPDGNNVAQFSSTNLSGGLVQGTKEIPPPKAGTWTVRYVATGAFTGDVFGIGLQESTRTI